MTHLLLCTAPRASTIEHSPDDLAEALTGEDDVAAALREYDGAAEHHVEDALDETDIAHRVLCERISKSTQPEEYTHDPFDGAPLVSG